MMYYSVLWFLTLQVAEHHAVICSLPPSQWDGEENMEKRKVELVG